MARKQLTTVFRYRLSGASSLYPPTRWVSGSYISTRPVAFDTIACRLAASWRKSCPGVSVIALEILS